MTLTTAPPATTLRQQVLAELVGSALLAACVVGSGIAATRLTTDVGLQLLVNAVVTGAVLVALILALGPVSAAFNPVVTLAQWALRTTTARAAAVHVTAQTAGCALGVTTANLMFDHGFALSTTERDGAALLTSEVVATFGLVLVVLCVLRSGNAGHVAYAVGGYITAAYWFTSSTSFANPAITVGRTLTDSFAGIAPASAPAFVVVQLVGAALALLTVRALYPRDARS